MKKPKKRFLKIAAAAFAVELALGATILTVNHLSSAPQADELGSPGLMMSENVLLREMTAIDVEGLSERTDPTMTEEKIDRIYKKKGVHVITLCEVKGSPYKKYFGTFGVDRIEDTQLCFLAPPTTFGCILGHNGASMKADSEHSNNFKTVSVSVTYSSGEVSTSYDVGRYTAIASVADKLGGKITNATYTFTMFAGTDENSDILEQAVVELHLNPRR